MLACSAGAMLTVWIYLHLLSLIVASAMWGTTGPHTALVTQFDGTIAEDLFDDTRALILVICFYLCWFISLVFWVSFLVCGLDACTVCDCRASGMVDCGDRALTQMPCDVPLDTTTLYANLTQMLCCGHNLTCSSALR